MSRHDQIIPSDQQPINKRSATYVVCRHQSHHVLINKSVYAMGLCRYTWERTHAITFNAVCSVPAGRFVLIRNYEGIIYYNYSSHLRE